MSDNPADSLRREPPDWTEMQKTAAKALLDYRLRTYVEAIRSAPNYDAAHHEPLLKQQAQAAQLDWEQAKAVADAIWPLVSAALEAARADERERLQQENQELRDENEELRIDNTTLQMRDKDMRNLTRRAYEALHAKFGDTINQGTEETIAGMCADLAALNGGNESGDDR